MKSILRVLTVLLVFTLFGCGGADDVAYVNPQSIAGKWGGWRTNNNGSRMTQRDQIAMTLVQSGTRVTGEMRIAGPFTLTGSNDRVIQIDGTYDQATGVFLTAGHTYRFIDDNTMVSDVFGGNDLNQWSDHLTRSL